MPRYEFVVDGRLGREILSAFPELDVATRAGMTVLSGVLTAPDGVREILVRLESFAIGLQSMRVIESNGAEAAQAARQVPIQDNPDETL